MILLSCVCNALEKHYNFCAHNQKILVNHFEKPRNVGSFDKLEKNIGTAIVGAPACGDVMKLQIKVCPKTNI